MNIGKLVFLLFGKQFGLCREKMGSGYAFFQLGSWWLWGVNQFYLELGICFLYNVHPFLLLLLLHLFKSLQAKLEWMSGSKVIRIIKICLADEKHILRKYSDFARFTPKILNVYEERTFSICENNAKKASLPVFLSILEDFRL